MFAATQTAFADALLDADAPVPADITTRAAADLPRRFAVYRNNVLTSLIDALRARFPATESAVGEEFFIAMAHVFARTEPPRTPLMFRYGEAFPDFIDRFPPAAEIAYLGDLARIEVARTQSNHAADAASLTPAALAAITPDALPALRLRLHPSVRVFSSPHPVTTIWAMNAGLIAPAAIENWRAEDVVIARPTLEVEVRAFAPGTRVFLERIKTASLGEAAEAARALHPDFDIAFTFATLLQAGVFAAAVPSHA